MYCYSNINNNDPSNIVYSQFGYRKLWIQDVCNLGILFFVTAFVMHKYYTGKGGEFEKKEIDSFTLKVINKLKRWGIPPLVPLITGLFLLFIAYIMLGLQSKCDFVCNAPYYIWKWNCIYCNSILAGFIMIFFGILLMSIGYTWLKYPDKLSKR